MSEINREDVDKLLKDYFPTTIPNYGITILKNNNYNLDEMSRKAANDAIRIGTFTPKPKDNKFIKFMKKGNEFFWGPPRPDAKYPALAQATDEWFDALNFLGPSIGAIKGARNISKGLDKYRDIKNTNLVIRNGQVFKGATDPNYNVISATLGREGARQGSFFALDEQLAARYASAIAVRFPNKTNNGSRIREVQAIYTAPAREVVQGGKTFSMANPNKGFIKELKQEVNRLMKKGNRNYLNLNATDQMQYIELNQLLNSITFGNRARKTAEQARYGGYIYGLTPIQRKFFLDRGYTNLYQRNGAHKTGVVVALRDVRPYKVTLRKDKFKGDGVYYTQERLKDSKYIVDEKILNKEVVEQGAGYQNINKFTGQPYSKEYSFSEYLAEADKILNKVGD